MGFVILNSKMRFTHPPESQEHRNCRLGHVVLEDVIAQGTEEDTGFVWAASSLNKGRERKEWSHQVSGSLLHLPLK